MRKKVKGTAATFQIDSYKEGDKTIKEYRCDLVKLAEEYSNWGDIPKYIGDARAMEISLLAKAYLKLKPQPTGEDEK